VIGIFFSFWAVCRQQDRDAPCIN